MAKLVTSAAWATDKFSADAYATEIVPFLERVGRLQPVLRAASGVARNLAGISVAQTDPLVARIAGEMEKLFLSEEAS